MNWEARFWERSVEQEGLVARFQLPGIGCTIDEWWRAKRTGRWVAWGPRVLAQRGLPITEQRRAMAAVLDASPGAMLHAESALAWFGVRGFRLHDVHVARPRDLSGATALLGQLHELRDVRAGDVIVARGLVTETPLRALWAVASRYASPPRRDHGAQRVGALLDQCHRMGLVTWEGLAQSVEELARRGRSGTVIMRSLADLRPAGSSATESRLEHQLDRVLDRQGERGLRRQVVVGGHEPIGRCDLVDDRLPLVVEVNSLTFHTTPSDRAADERRYRQLVEAGFTVCVIWEDDLWSDPSGVAETVALARRRASRRECVVIHSPGCPWADDPAPLAAAA